MLIPSITINELNNFSNHTILDGFTSVIPKFNEILQDDTISISGDGDFAFAAQENGWPGAGTASNPYRIDGLMLRNPNQDLIVIGWTSVHFQISNCILYDGYNGIYFHSVQNGEIINTTILNCDTSILIENSQEITILENNLSNTYSDSIRLQSSSYITITKNNIYNGSTGVSLSDSYSCQISDNTISRQSHGIHLDNSLFNVITHNIIYNIV